MKQGYYLPAEDGNVGNIQKVINGQQPLKSDHYSQEWIAENKQLLGSALKYVYLHQAKRARESGKLDFANNCEEEAGKIKEPPLTQEEVFIIAYNNLRKILEQNSNLRPEGYIKDPS